MSEAKLPKRIRNHVNPLADTQEYHFGGFSNNLPIIVDIGAYRGEFTQKLVDHFAETRNYIVTEIRKPYAAYLRDLFSDNKQVRVFAGDSVRNLKNLLQPSIEKGVTIEYIFFNFPDPWFKEKHKKRRVVSQRMLDDIGQWLPSQTKLVFQTDQLSLFEETKELLSENGFTFNEFKDPLWGIRSYWEEMKIGEGDQIYRLYFTNKI